MVQEEGGDYKVTEADLISQANEGFRKWLNVNELFAHISVERQRMPGKTPTIYIIAFNINIGYVTLDVDVVKLVKVVDEASKLIDLELHIVNDAITEPLKLMASVFVPGASKDIQFCRCFSNAKHRDAFFDDIRFLSDVNNDYRLAHIERMRRQFGGFSG